MAIREGSTCAIRSRFFNSLKLPTIPSTAHYRLRDVTNNRTIIDWTDVTGSLVNDLDGRVYVDVQISPESNAIYRDSVSIQEHAFVMQADQGLATQWTDEVRYQITNLAGYQSR